MCCHDEFRFVGKGRAEALPSHLAVLPSMPKVERSPSKPKQWSP
jgi:hypothetical protein